MLSRQIVNALNNKKKGEKEKRKKTCIYWGSSQTSDIAFK